MATFEPHRVYLCRLEGNSIEMQEARRKCYEILGDKKNILLNHNRTKFSLLEVYMCEDEFAYMKLITNYPFKMIKGRSSVEYRPV